MDKKQLSRLVERAQKGDAQAFAHLYKEFSQNVYYIALRMMKNEDDAKDVLQDVMLTLFGSIGTLRDPRSIGAFLARTTHHRCLRVLRGRESVSDEEAEHAIRNLPEDNEEFIPEEYAARQELRQVVIDSVEELSPALRAVVLLFYFEEQSIKQIAQALGLKNDAVKIRLHRARIVLREKLEQHQKEGVVRAMAVPLLTQILQDNARMVFSPEVSGPVWESIGTEMGLPAAAIAESAAVATGAAAVAGAAAAGETAAVLGMSGGAKLLAAVLVTTATTAVVLVGSPGTDRAAPAQEFPPPSSPTAVVLEEAQDEEPTHAPTPGGSAGSDIYTPQDSPASSPRAPSGAQELRQPRSSTSNDGGQGWPDDAGATTPAEGSGSGASGGNSSTEVIGISLRNDRLTYPAGTTLTAGKIIADAGVSTTGWDGGAADLEVTGLNGADQWKPGKYGVMVQIPAGDGEVRHRVAVVVVIE